MLNNYLQLGIYEFYCAIPIGLIIFSVFIVVKLLAKRKYEFNPIIMLCGFAWILMVLTILKITGIIGDYFGTTSLFHGILNFNFRLFKDGLSIATLLNIILFIPFGFFSAVVFKKLRDKWIYGVLIGLIFSAAIEFL